MNKVIAAFGASRNAKTRPLYQYDYGQILVLAGPKLPPSYEVHFSNQAESGRAKTMIGNADGVSIPDEYLRSGQTIYAWVFLHGGDSDGATKYTVTIPVTQRSLPTDQKPTPIQQGVIDQTIAALNNGVQIAQEAAEDAQEAAEEAKNWAHQNIGVITPQEIDEILFGGT